MKDIVNWLQEKRSLWRCDFIGIAVNCAPANAPQTIRWRYVSGNKSEAYQKIRLKVGRGIAGMVWKTGRPQADEAIFSQPDKLLEYPIARVEALDSMLAVPVTIKNEVIGILAIGFRHTHAFTPTEIKAVVTAAEILAPTLKELES